MAISREARLVRVYNHTKQDRGSVGIGVPRMHDLKEGVPVLSTTSEGLVQYVRHNNELYKTVMKKSLDSEDVIGFGDNGYIKFSNGLIMQWGKVTASNATETVTFPIAFPTACLNVVCTDYQSADTGGLGGVSGIKTLATTTTVEFSCYTTADSFFWQAIGH
jgi:hypothetical protein